MLRFVCVMLLFPSTLAFGQFFYRFEPYDYQLTTPPQVAIPHKKVAVYPKGELGSEELGTALRNVLLDEYEVLAREDLDSILSEHDLSLDGVISKNKALGIGKFLGPTALLIIDLQRLRVSDQKVSSGAKRSITLKADFRVVDVANGRVVFSKAISEQLEEIGAVDFPDEEILREKVFQKVGNTFAGWFVAKTETKRLEFHTPKRQPSFKEAFAHLAGGNVEQALEVMKTSVDGINVHIAKLEADQKSLSGKPLKKNVKMVKKFRQDLGRGWQNMALIHLIMENYQQARMANGKAKAFSDMGKIYQFPAFIDKCERLAAKNRDYERVLKSRS